jgi:hypothetical protein
MPVLTPVFHVEEKSLLDLFVKSPLKVPAWLVLLVVLLATASGFAVGRHKPAHHYVSYFGYPMVLDTTTGKACYTTKPTPAEAGSLRDTSLPVYEDSNRLDTYVPNGASVPLCGQD